MSETHNYQEQIVAFIDLLGFKNAMDSDNAADILRLLQKFSEQKCSSSTQNVQVSESRQHYEIAPAISTFSDNVILSYPVSNDMPQHVIIISLCQYISWFAALALDAGFLIRGGIAKGMLYHKNGVVFGKALVDAYLLESNVASYPRVVLSQGIIQSCEFKHIAHHVKLDFDEVPILDYYTGMFNAGIPPGNKFFESLKTRLSRYDQTISINIKTLESHPSQLSKWNWFFKYYSIAKQPWLSILQKCKL